MWTPISGMPWAIAASMTASGPSCRRTDGLTSQSLGRLLASPISSMEATRKDENVVRSSIE
ncbi:hypothetical protein D3C87_1748170 [compost metagenome]